MTATKTELFSVADMVKDAKKTCRVARMEMTAGWDEEDTNLIELSTAQLREFIPGVSTESLIRMLDYCNQMITTGFQTGHPQVAVWTNAEIIAQLAKDL